MNICKEKLNNYNKLNIENAKNNTGGNIYLVNEKLLYKVFNDPYFYIKEVERNIDFQIKKHIPNTPIIYDKLYIDNLFVGYIMEYINNSVTFRDAIGLNVDIDLKIKAIKDIYYSLKYLHSKNIFLGDVHLDNILITKSGKGYLTDLDYMRFSSDQYKFHQYYLIKPNNNSYKINIASKYTDNIKIMISALSLLLEKDLETYISKDTFDINLEQIYIDIIIPLNNRVLNDYFLKIMNKEDTNYFDECCLSSLNKCKKLIK